MMQLAAPSFGTTGLLSLLIGFLIVFIIYLLVIGFVLWLAGEIVVGRRVTFGEALGVAGVGTFLVGAIVVFLLLVKHYFRTGWLGAIGVGIMAIVVGIVIAFVLVAVGLAAIFVLPRFF